jgi:hypothetical protein
MPILQKRVFELDMVGDGMSKEELLKMLDWADIIHFHNRWKRQKIFEFLGITPPKKPSVIQLHSPRFSEDFTEEATSGVPLAIIAQYHTRQWSELTYVVPNVVDVYDKTYLPMETKPSRGAPVVSYAPSNTNAKGWDDKGYHFLAPHLKRLKFGREIIYQLIVDKPHAIAMEMKRGADIGIDEIVTGSYHMSALEYMAMGVPCFSHLDGLTTKVVKDLTGADVLPFIDATKDTFLLRLRNMIRTKEYIQLGKDTRKWMETYWDPNILVKHYEDMYDDL